jgi:hypothetical protein
MPHLARGVTEKALSFVEIEFAISSHVDRPILRLISDNIRMYP